MYKYKTMNGEIVAMQQTENGKTLRSYAKALLPYDDLEWQETDREIASIGGKLLFADTDEYKKAKAAQEEAEKEQAEAEALKPTVDDLQEALSILSDIVLGGTE